MKLWLAPSLLLMVSLVARAEYPQIQTLDGSDDLFRQLQADIRQGYRAHAGEQNPAAGLIVFRYRKKHADSIVSLAASTNLPVGTLATINRISSYDQFARLKFVLIPNRAGLFVPVLPANMLEEIMFAWRVDPSQLSQVVSVCSLGSARSSNGVQSDRGMTRFYYFPGQRFHPVENAYFMKTLFRYPLARVEITSPFGQRISPLSGHLHFHKGLDLRARAGTEVFSAGDGEVTDVGFHPIYGRYIVISHPGGFETLYGHLSTTNLNRGQQLRAGAVIGKAGNTGSATGPHLHFEIRRQGVAKDPLALLRK